MRLFYYSTICILAFLLSACSQIKQKNNENPPEFSFVMVINKGYLESNILTFSTNDIERIITFTSPPYHIIKELTFDSFSKIWFLGDDSFANNPPNAVLSSDNNQATIQVLEKMIIEGKLIKFQLNSNFTESKRLKLNNITLMIDNAEIKTNIKYPLQCPNKGGSIEWGKCRFKK